MAEISITVHTEDFLGDELNTVSLYRNLRERYDTVFLLESADYHARENRTTLLCFDILGELSISQGEVTRGFGDFRETTSLNKPAVDTINGFMQAVHFENDVPRSNGIFGYCGFNAVEYFDTHTLKSEERDGIPDIYYAFFRFILQIDSLDGHCRLIENVPAGESSRMQEIKSSLYRLPAGGSEPFRRRGAEQANMSDDEYMEMVRRGKYHCQQGDVFQIVLSRRFEQAFTGDDFNVYRALRSINPSPYMYCFQFAGYSIIGASPEAEVIVDSGEAELHPIAGTYRRTSDDEEDRRQALALADDPKESSEHVMLVDLARNDLSRNCRNVTVQRFKEIQYFSHVIHLVSRVTGQLDDPAAAVKVLADTFPAGTLSGAPKYKAVELIDRYEPHRRGYYGGAIGYITFGGDLNHAITIRSFLCKEGTLRYQAGAGVVISSVEESERDEVRNKLAALKKALAAAEEIR
ncbi:MAG: anthranilate synthase component I family protein [Fibrobacterota bacterium]